VVSFNFVIVFSYSVLLRIQQDFVEQVKFIDPP